MRPANFYRPIDVGRMLGMSANNVVGLIKTGALVASDVSSATSKRPRYLISPTDLQAFIDSRRTVKPASRARPRKQKPVKQYI